MEKKGIYDIPATSEKREELRRLIGEFAAARSLTPPLSMETLDELAGEFIAEGKFEPAMRGWVMVELNNAAWRDVVASVPHARRILLLPACLRRQERCSAAVDEIGLLCRRCGSCSINSLEDKAAQLGVMTIVSEGFTAAVGLIESGAVDAVIGIGCLDSLEKAFPMLIGSAVPGVAVALNGDGCRDTDVDENRVVEMIGMLSDSRLRLMDYGYLDSTVKEWFAPGSLKSTILAGNDPTSRIALDWMATGGKRWRPYLLAATYLALSGEERLPEKVRYAALAVECFHKASLVHDDIQDNDEERYGEKTLWARHGTPIAINAGDILLGEGYRLLAGGGDVELLRAVAAAHISLCRGQGMELEWSRSPAPFDMEFVLDIFRGKTVPAFEVSLAIGAICADANPSLREVLQNYSEALGIAYQLGDDLEDFESDSSLALRPSAVLAAVFEQCGDAAMRHEILTADDLGALLGSPRYRPFLDGALQRVRSMAASYRSRALDTIREIDNMELKRLLFRILERIIK